MVRLSVALVTRNRPESLNRSLESLRRQTVQPYEVVVSDDSDPEQAHATKEIADRWDCRYITGLRRGLYANRNHIALACDGTHIRTMDDDHLFPPGHLELCMEAVHSDLKSIWTTGEISFINGKYYGTSPTAGQLAPCGCSAPVYDVNDNWAIADGSTIYPREIFTQGYRMVELGYGSSYLEFGAYLYHHGFRSRCILGALVKHYPADGSILIRRKTRQAFESKIFACLCYNLYFRPKLFSLVRYLLPSFIRLRFDRECFYSTFESWKKAQERWSIDRQLPHILSQEFSPD